MKVILIHQPKKNAQCDKILKARYHVRAVEIKEYKITINNGLVDYWLIQKKKLNADKLYFKK